MSSYFSISDFSISETVQKAISEINRANNLSEELNQRAQHRSTQTDTILVFTLNGLEKVGYALAKPLTEKKFVANFVFVKPHFQRQGHGSYLMEELFKQLTSNKIYELLVICSDKELTFFEKIANSQKVSKTENEKTGLGGPVENEMTYYLKV